MLSNLLHGLTALGNGQAILYLVLGALIGMVFGVIPGLASAVILSIILAFSYHVNLLGTLALFLGAQSGSYFSASITSILINTPAHPEAFAITFDGYPMARKGQAGRALGISATSTCIGGLVGCIVLVGFIPILNSLPGLVHPPEYVVLIGLAMVLVGTLSTDSVLKALISTGIGFAFAGIGPSIVTGTFRYTFGATGLLDGLSLVALALGLFAIPQMAMVFGTGTAVALQDMTGKHVPQQKVEEATITKDFNRQVVGGLLETFRHWVLLIQSGIIGALTGIVPGIGGFAANFMSYGIARQTSRKRELFGTGIAEGVIAPEGSSLAKEAGSMIPIIGLGVPGSVGGALFIAALSIKSIKVGYGFSTAYPILPYEIVWCIAITGIIGTAAGLLIAPQLAKITRIPGPMIVPFVVAFSVIGPYLANISFFSCMEVLVFGIVGLVLRRLQYPLASFVLGLVLGPTFETNIYLTHSIYHGASFLWKRPAADVGAILIVLILVAKALETRRRRRLSEGKNDNSVSDAMPPSAPTFPYLAALTSVCILAFAIFFIAYGVARYNFAAGVMPIMGASFVFVGIIFQLPIDVKALIAHRRVAAVSSPEHGDIAPALSGDEVGTVPHCTESRLRPIALHSWSRNGQFTRELSIFIWLGALLGACYVIGFVWGTALFVLAYGMTCTRRSITTLRMRLIFSIVSAALIWVTTHELFVVTKLQFIPVLH